MRLYLAIILLGILIAGCTQGTASPQGAPPPAAPGQPPLAPSPSAPPPSAPPTNPPPSLPPNPPPAVNPYSGKTLESIAASGDSVECDITFNYQNKPATAKFYMKGTLEMRFEETTSGISQCTKTITIIREGRRYAGCEGKTVMPGCDWFRSDHSGGLPDQFRDLPAGNVNCRAWTYDKSWFTTPGQHCSMG